MPPKKAAKKAVTPPLDGCRIALSGTFPGESHAAITGRLEELGATLAKNISGTTTHVVATDADFARPSQKVKYAQGNGMPIVPLGWLEDCLAQGTRLDESGSAFGASIPSPAPAPASAPGPPPAPVSIGSRKRAIKVEDSEDEIADKPGKKKLKPETEEFGKAQIATANVRVPLDETCPYSTHSVYIDDDGVIYDASLNQTNASNNNNKFYRIQVLRSPSGDWKTWTRWGRVGEPGSSAALGDGSRQDALKKFEAKFKDKTGNSWADRGADPRPKKYVFVERSYAPDSDDDDDDAAAASAESPDTSANSADPVPESKLPPSVQDLMSLIFDQEYFAQTMAAFNYDSKKLPLGKLSKSTILRGYQALKDLSALFNDAALSPQFGDSYQEAIANLSNRFFSLIPHDFGRNRPPVIANQLRLKPELELLESLSDMKDAAGIMKGGKDGSSEKINILDQQFRGLNMEEMAPLKHDSSEFVELKNYLMNTRGSTHNADYQIAEIFRIERRGEKERFDSSPFAGPPRDRRLLWHGSRCTNFGGILSQGLRIAPPEAPVSGYMFGKGVYLADMGSKSAGYCVPHVSNGHALLLLCEAELGDPMQELINASYTADETARAGGMISTWGKGRTGPTKWKDAGCVHPSLEGVQMPDTTVKPASTSVRGASLLYNEYIAYDVAQIRLRYLFRVRM